MNTRLMSKVLFQLQKTVKICALVTLLVFLAGNRLPTNTTSGQFESPSRPAPVLKSSLCSQDTSLWGADRGAKKPSGTGSLPRPSRAPTRKPQLTRPFLAVPSIKQNDSTFFFFFTAL